MKIILTIVQSGYKRTTIEIDGELILVEKLLEAVKSAAKEHAPYCEIR